MQQADLNVVRWWHQALNARRPITRWLNMSMVAVARRTRDPYATSPPVYPKDDA